MNNFFKIIFLLLVIWAGFFYKDKIRNIWQQSYTHYFPCKQAIAYSIGTFDTEFGITKDDFISALNEAEAVWEEPLGKDLFAYKDGGILTVNLVYDKRQELTEEIKNIGGKIDDSMANYELLKSKYLTLVSQHNQNLNDFEVRLKSFEARKKLYEDEVNFVNSHGATSKVISRLNAEKEYLNKEIVNLNSIQSKLAEEVRVINSSVSTVNQLAERLNIDVKKVNTISGSLSGEFDEGVYRSSLEGQEIDIYQFDSHSKLVRVLAHEMGHALGLDHVDDPKAIMYWLNSGTEEKLSPTDLSLLKDQCGIK